MWLKQLLVKAEAKSHRVPQTSPYLGSPVSFWRWSTFFLVFLLSLMYYPSLIEAFLVALNVPVQI